MAYFVDPNPTDLCPAKKTGYIVNQICKKYAILDLKNMIKNKMIQ